MSTKSTADVAKRLVTLCRENKWEQAQKELYAENAVSIEPHTTPGFAKETKGLPAIEEKGRKWKSSMEKMNHLEVSEPMVVGDSFACSMRIDATMKGKGKMDMAELCVYEVKEGKIVAEQFHM